MNEIPEHAAALRWLGANLHWSASLERCRRAERETARVIALTPWAQVPAPGAVDDREHRVA